MVRSLVDEVVRRRLWPIPLLAVLIAIAAPLLFMKSAPDASDAIVPPPSSELRPLSTKANDLMNGSDRDVAPRKLPGRKRQDPFVAPASTKKAVSTEAAGGGAAGETAAAQQIPVVITSSDGSTSTATVTTGKSATNGKSAKSKPAKAATSGAKPSRAPKVTTTKPATSATTSAAIRTATFVDVRFAERQGTMTRYRVPRLQTFRAGGKIAAMFVGYSTSRRAATFAIAPTTTVRGPAKCRSVKRVCRYVDVPQGSYARLTLRGEDGTLISRRLDVVRVRRLPATAKAMPRLTSMKQASCLVKTLLALPAIAPSISTDACE